MALKDYKFANYVKNDLEETGNMVLSFSCFIFLQNTLWVEYHERICPKKHLLFYFFLIDFSPFTTGCDYRNYENDINIFFKIWILVVLSISINKMNSFILFNKNLLRFAFTQTCIINHPSHTWNVYLCIIVQY